MIDRLTPPPIYSPVDFTYTLPPCANRLLDNGIPLYVVNDCIEPVVQIDMVFPAGMWHESKTAIAHATAALLKSGTSTKSSLEINAHFEQYGASVKAGAGSDWASLSVSCMTRHLNQLLPLMAELLHDTIFPQHEIDIYIQNARQRLSVQLKKSDFIANRLIDRYLFGEHHPYGKYTEMADYDNITREALTDHLKKHYSSASCQLFMAGQFTEKDIDLVNQYIGSSNWNSSAAATPEYAIEPTAQKIHRIQHDEQGVQGAIRLIRPFPEKQHPDFAPMIVLNTLFGGYFGSRLMSNIREEKGYTYGIHSYLYNNLHHGAYMITTEVGKEVCDATIREIHLEMKRLQDELVEPDELMLVKNYLLGSILGDLDGAFQIMQRWKNLILNGFTQDRFYNNLSIYKHITAEEIQSLARKYLNKDDFYELIVI
jgi:predicted Zn-dependent peptidase